MDNSSLYAPAFDASRADVEYEINLINALSASLDPADDQYFQHRAYYAETLGDLYNRLAQYPSTSGYQLSAAPSPGESSGSSSRKRGRDDFNEDTSLNTTPGASPGTPLVMEYPGYGSAAAPGMIKREMPSAANFIDLTMDEPVADPFPELHHAYQPGQTNQPMDAFNQDWMSTDQLAQLLLSPTPASGAYGYPVQPPLLPWSTPVFPAATHRSAQFPGFDHDPFAPDDGVNNPEAVQDLIENIKLQEEIEPEAREQTPRAMCSTLMEHQKIALTWLLKMERGKTKAAILADEMGLGKTVEALALILANPSDNPACKTTLIVAPVALMRQWEKEIKRHVHQDRQLSVYIYHGNNKKADFDRLRNFDVVLTTFGTMAQEYKLKEERMLAESKQREQQQTQVKRPTREMFSLLGQKSMWYRVILDEAQCIKNRSTLTSRAANDLQARHRLCMTGTPMMNSIDELYPLIRFLKIPPYNVWGKFSSEISKLLKTNASDLHSRAMGRVQAVLKSIMLRRGKTTIVDGKQICEIPPKHTHMQSVRFSEPERALYNAVETSSQLRLNRYLKKGTVNNNYASILVMLLRLRQLCCHPFLVKDLGVQASTEGIAEDTLLHRAHLLADDVVKRLTDTDSFECPICYETDANPTIIIPCGHTTCGECFQKLIDPARAAQAGNESGSARCPHCRGTVSSDNITDFQHFCKVFCPEKLTEMLHGTDGGDSDGVPQTDSDSDSDSQSDESETDDGEDESLGGFIVPDGDTDMDDAEDRLKSEDATTPPMAGPSEPTAKGKTKAKGKGKGKAKMKTKPTLTLAQLKKESHRSAAAKKKYLRRLRKKWESSSKIDKTMELLADIRAADPTEKTLIFSQFTSLLDLLEVLLSDQNFKYRRYDGSMRMDDRAEAVNQFMDSTDENIMLVSLKAGNAGLNLSKASQVIMFDPFWNPFVEEQAVDRAHRMPQKREVHVHRVLVPDTVEDRICDLQDKKREIINTALDEGVSKSLTRLSVGELRYLFGIR